MNNFKIELNVNVPLVFVVNTFKETHLLKRRMVLKQHHIGIELGHISSASSCTNRKPWHMKWGQKFE